MKDQLSFTPLIEMFSLMVEPDIEKMGDKKAFKELQRLLDLEDPFILITKLGPMFFGLARRFGLISPFKGTEKMDLLNPEIVCRLLISWEKWRQSVLELDEAKSFVCHLNSSFEDKPQQQAAH